MTKQTQQVVPLTARQEQILEILKRRVGKQTSYGLIARILGLKSRAGIHKHITVLHRKGYVTRQRIARCQTFIALDQRAVEMKPVNLTPPLPLTMPEELRWEIWERDNYQCLKCGSRRCLTVDHMVPWQLGGEKLDKENLQTLCRGCNSAKRRRVENYLTKNANEQAA